MEGAEIMRMAYEAHQDDNDFIQPGTLYRQVMTPTDRDHLVANIVGPLSQGVERVIHADQPPSRTPIPTSSCHRHRVSRSVSTA